MNVGTPEIIWFVLAGLSLLAGAILDGEPRKGKHSLAGAMLSACISFGLLWWGGFFA